MAFNLPTPEGDEGAAITKDGLVFRGEVIPYLAVEKIVGDDKELELIFNKEYENGLYAEREPLVFMVEEGCAHQLLDLERMIHTHLMQLDLAEFDEKRENVINGPKFDMRKIRNSYKRAYAFGG